MSMLNSGVRAGNNLVQPISWIATFVFKLPLVTKLQVTQSPNCDPTFMPITSVFCLKDNTPIELQNANSLSLLVQGKWTPFHSLYMTQNRESHITFNSELNNLLLKAMAEPDLPKDLTPILNLLLND